MRTLSVADYFVEFLIANGITDVFGYQGGMIAYLFDSLKRYKGKINYHSCGNEQGAAFAACAYAQATHNFGVAISTSGPGFTNMVTGIANAWFDSIPVLFVSGNVNTKDKKRSNSFRQNGFQEIQAAEIAKPITKKAIEVELDTNFIKCFDEALTIAKTSRQGPVYIDLPINVCRETVTFDKIKPVKIKPFISSFPNHLRDLLSAKKPIIYAGAGIKQVNCIEKFRKLISILKIPVITSMPGIDLLPSNSKYNIGYVGGTGRREAGIVLQNTDFVLSIGTRICSKQVGHNLSLFAPKAKKFIRIDIDKAEFERKIKKNEIELPIDINAFIDSCISSLKSFKSPFELWSDACYQLKKALINIDVTEANAMCKNLTSYFPDNANVLLDVGKNLNYCAQSMVVKDNTKVYMSAGLGSMGYSIPAAIGAYYGNKKPTFSINGDGGTQMNIQELNTIVKNKLPIKIFILNNKALGNIVLFQDNFLNSRYAATREKDHDYFSCDFTKVAIGYGIKSIKITNYSDFNKYKKYLSSRDPILFDIYYEDCPALPGIVAGGDFSKGLNAKIIKQIVGFIKKYEN